MNGGWFGKVSKALACDPKVRPTAKAVYLVLAVHADGETRECWVSNSTIAVSLGLSRRSVVSHINHLIAAGYLERTPRFVEGAQRSNLYRLRARGV